MKIAFKPIQERYKFVNVMKEYKDNVNKTKEEFKKIEDFKKLNELISGQIDNAKKIKEDILSNFPGYISRTKKVSDNVAEMLMELENDKQRQKDLIKENNKFGTLISEAQNSFKNYTKCDRDIETFEEKEKKYDRALKQVKDYKQDIEHLQDKKEYLEEFIKEHSKTLKKKKARKAEATDVHTFMYREARITVRKNDLVEEYVDAIVNPANEELNHAGGAARAIASKAGPEFEKECEDYISENYKLKTGSSMVTTAGGELKCDYVIHTVGPIYEKNKKSHAKECEQLKKCFESILKIMIARDFYDISIPAISTGIFGFPIKKCVEICAKTIKTTIDNNHKAFKGKEIILCNFDDKTTTVFQNLLQTYMEPESDDEDSAEERKDNYEDETPIETIKNNEDDYSSEDYGALHDDRDGALGNNVDSDY